MKRRVFFILLSLLFNTLGYAQQVDVENNLNNCLCLHVKGIVYQSNVELINQDNNPIVLYSKDSGITWDTLKGNKKYFFQDSCVYFKGYNPDGFSHNSEQYSTLSISGGVLSGSVMSLINGNGNDTIIPNDYCFYMLFYDDDISGAPELPATVLTNNCYQKMFFSTEIKEAPNLPAKVLKEGCYMSMFAYTPIESAPIISATVMADSCCSNMFSHCESLKTAPELPATKLGRDCYNTMFAYCKKLKSAPELPATKLAKGCYNSMFYGCDSLSVPPTLPATIMEENCYQEMFAFCKNLRTVPNMPESFNIADRCFKKMFTYCDNLSGYPAGILENILCFTAEEGGSTFSVKDRTYSNSIRYSLDGGKTWNRLDETPITLEKEGDKAYIIGDLDYEFTYGTDGAAQFFITGAIAASGSVSSILDECGSVLVLRTCLNRLFAKCEGLTKAPELPMRVLLLEEDEAWGAGGSYSSMFSGCVNLREAPELPATTLSYACYHNMFYGCTQLKKAPSLLADTLADGCYWGMFAKCENLVEIPILPATRLAPLCYRSMFDSCVSLVDVPGIMATDLGNSRDESMRRMFNGCESLRHIKVAFEDWSNATPDWVKGVPDGGWFECPESLEITYGDSRVPMYWNINESKVVDFYGIEGVHIWSDEHSIFVEGSKCDVFLYDLLGHLLSYSEVSNDVIRFNVDKKGTYLLKIGNQTKKVVCM